MPTIIELNRQAVKDSIEAVSHVSTDDLDRPTPCADWTLGELIAHMTAQHRGFAAAAAGEGANPLAWAVHKPGPSTVKAYVEAANGVIQAFGADGVADRQFALPELTTNLTFPGAQAIGFHFIDYVVHTWDVARSIDRQYDPAPELVDPAYDIAMAVPDGPERLQPGAAFEPSRAQQPDATRWHQILRALGRSPNWPD